MKMIRVRPRTRGTVLLDARGRTVPYDAPDGTLGVRVPAHDPFWLRRIRDGDAAVVTDDEAEADAKEKAEARVRAEAMTPVPARPSDPPPTDTGRRVVLGDEVDLLPAGAHIPFEIAPLLKADRPPAKIVSRPKKR